MTEAVSPSPTQRAVCPICGIQIRRSVRADYAPFLVRRCGLDADTEVRANFCDNCEHLFFTPPLDAVALRLLYTDYLGPDRKSVV